MNPTATLAVMASINNFIKDAMVETSELLIKRIDGLLCVQERATEKKQNMQHVVTSNVMDMVRTTV